MHFAFFFITIERAAKNIFQKELICLKTIIFIGTNKSGSSREAIKAAMHLGYFTVLFTNNKRQIKQRTQYDDVHEMVFVNTDSISEMEQAIKKLSIQGKVIQSIVSFIDANVYKASMLADIFCQNPLSSEAIEIMENKAKTQAFLKGQPYIPTHDIISPGARINAHALLDKHSVPLIVKSSTSTGSKDVLLARTKQQLTNHIKKLQMIYQEDKLIVEEYIEGDQYLVEAIVHNDEVQIAAIVKQEITFDKRFIITGYGVLAHVPTDIQKGIETVLKSVVHQFSMRNGSLHLELRLTKNGWKLIEINPRISGGAMNKMLEAAFGFNLVKETLKISLGEAPSIVPKHKIFVYTQYVTLSESGVLEKVTGKGRARKSPGIIDVYVKPKRGTRLKPPLSMGHRYAYVIATADTIEDAEKRAKDAASEIKFHLDTEEYSPKKGPF